MDEESDYYHREMMWTGKERLVVRFSDLMNRIEFPAKEVFNHGTLAQQERLAKAMERCGDMATELAEVALEKHYRQERKRSAAYRRKYPDEF